MPVQWLGWRPDYEASRRGLDLQEKELGSRRESGSESLRRALEGDAWERLFKEKALTQRGTLAREAEKGRGERAEASTERLISANEKLQ